MRQAVILAGGEGTRLKSILGDLPKPLVDVAGIPLLERQILELKKYGFSQILLLVNYKHKAIASFLESKKFFDLDIIVLNDGPDALGNGGALLGAYEYLDVQFLVLYGDTLFDIAIDKMLEFHEAKLDSDTTIFVHPNDHPEDSDLVITNNDDLVINFLGYPHPRGLAWPNLVNAAFYICTKKALQQLLPSKNQKSDIAKNLFPKLLNLGLKIYAYSSPEYIKDCGTPDRLSKATVDLLSGHVASRNLRYKQKAIFFDRDGTLNELCGHISSPKHLMLIEGAGAAIRKVNRSGRLAILVTNQPVIARGDCTEEELKNIHYKLEMELSKYGAYLDGIFYCPHHPESGFKDEVAKFKINCSCRKPMPGLIKLASEKFNVDQYESWVIGDSTADIGAAKNAGLRSIIVKTGNKGLDLKYQYYPDFEFPTLISAIDFILVDFDLNIQEISNFFSSKPGQFIFIGGASRSGKSTLASLIKYSYQYAGVRVVVINLDCWLKSESERGGSVEERYDIEAIENLISSIIDMKNPIKIEIPFYNKLKRVQTKYSNNFEYINPGDKVVFEGTIALSLKSSIRHIRLHLRIDEALRLERFNAEYKSRGYDDLETINLHNSRLEELEYIELNSHQSTGVTFINNVVNFDSHDNK